MITKKPGVILSSPATAGEAEALSSREQFRTILTAA